MLSGTTFGLGCWLQNMLQNLTANLETFRLFGKVTFGIGIGLFVIISGLLCFMIYRGQLNALKSLLAIWSLSIFLSVTGGYFLWYDGPDRQTVFSNLCFTYITVSSLGFGFGIGEIVQHSKDVLMSNLSNTIP